MLRTEKMNTEDRIQNVSSKPFRASLTTEKSRSPQSDIRNYRWLLISFLALLVACGYQMVGKKTHVPPGLTSIAIPTFKNRTFEPGIEIPLTQAVLNEFIQDRRVKVVSRAEADSILEGVVTNFTTPAVAYDRSGFVLEYFVTVNLRFTLKDRTGKILWDDSHGEVQWFRASSVGVTNEAAKQAAIQKAAGAMAERIRSRFFYNF
jgi:outer membrane lipopolysaccharide assembly protein LptE/RlpB